MNIVLIGFMGTGKTRVGRLLAQRLGRKFIDTDERIAQDVGMSVAQLIKTKGEQAFRELEAKIIQKIAQENFLVISTGGGVPMNPNNMDALQQNGEIVWLQASPEIILKRAGDLQSRPLIDPQNPLESIRERMKDRQSAYELAHHIIETDFLSPADVVDKIMELIPSLEK